MCADFTVFGKKTSLLSSVRLAALAPRGRGWGGGLIEQRIMMKGGFYQDSCGSGPGH